MTPLFHMKLGIDKDKPVEGLIDKPPFDEVKVQSISKAPMVMQGNSI